MTERDVAIMLKQAAMMAERVPRLTRKFEDILYLVAHSKRHVSERFEAMYVSSRSECHLSDLELESIGLTIARLAEAQCALPVPEELRAGPLTELRRELSASTGILASKMRISEPVIIMVESGKRRMDKKIALTALGVAVQHNVRESLISQLDYLAYGVEHEPRPRGGYQTGFRADISQGSGPIIAVREALHLSQEEMADRLGVVRDSIARWERQGKWPGTEAVRRNLHNLASEAGVDLGEWE